MGKCLRATFDVELEETVLDLKAKIEEEEEFP